MVRPRGVTSTAPRPRIIIIEHQFPAAAEMITRLWRNFLVTAAGTRHEGELHSIRVSERVRETQAGEGGDVRRGPDELLGDLRDESTSDERHGNAQFELDSEIASERGGPAHQGSEAPPRAKDGVGLADVLALRVQPPSEAEPARREREVSVRDSQRTRAEREARESN